MLGVADRVAPQTREASGLPANFPSSAGTPPLGSTPRKTRSGWGQGARLMNRRSRKPSAAPSVLARHRASCSSLLIFGTRSRVQRLAQFHVAQPDVVKGEAVVGDHAAAYSGPGDTEKLRQGHEVEAIYDFTDRWELVAKGLLLEPVGEPLEAKNYQLGLHYELVQRHGEGFALAFRTLYGFSAESGCLTISFTVRWRGLCSARTRPRSTPSSSARWDPTPTRAALR